MRIVLGTDLGDGGFPGPLAGAAAVLDEAWVDVAGLVAILEVRLGLSLRDPPGEAERAAALARVLRAAGPAPWSRSLEVDPLATARSVLRLKDALAFAGVDDTVDASTLPGRLAAVHALARGALPGIPERLAACVAALRDGGRARIERVEVVDDLQALPRTVRGLLDALADDGAIVGAHTIPTLDDDADSDLAAARRAQGEACYVGDGSLVLLRPDTVDEAAADVAMFAAGHAGPLLVIGGDVVLDEALVRMGAPPLGARGDVGTDALLSLLPLTVALGEPAVDPERLFEAVSLPVSVLPRGLAGRVRRALTDTPSATAPDVLAAVVEAVAERSERHGEAAGTALADRLAALLPAWAPALSRPAAPVVGADGGVDVAGVRSRAVLLLQLLFGRQQRDFGDEERTPYRAAMRQCGVFIRLLEALGVDRITPPQLARLVRSATSSVRAAAPFAAAAGLWRLSRPGAVLGPAPTIIWWGFTRESGRLPPRTLLVDERQHLLQRGFDPGAIDALAAGWAEASRRPLQLARERLILVAPQRGVTGREHHPHPLWDEILARAPANERRAATRNLVRPDDDGARGLVPRVPPVVRPMPAPRPLHVIGAGTVHPREVTSPSREELLLGCGLRFVLEERGASARPLRVKRGVTLEGDVVHAVVGAVLKGGIDGVDAEEVERRARAAFAEVVPPLAGEWLRPGREQVRHRVRERATRAAVALVATLQDNQLTVGAVEAEVSRELPTPVEGTVLQRTLKGTPDLVVVGVDDGRSFPFVIDHKTGREEHRRTLLRLGVPLQLLAYARLVGDKTMAPPGFGYFIIRSRRLLTSDTRLRGVDLVPADRSARDGWGLIEAARRKAFDELARGEIPAPGAAAEVPDEIAIEHQRVVIGPPCRWCRADTICGAAFKEELLHG